MVKFKKTALSVLSIGMAACLSTSIAAMALAGAKDQGGAPVVTGEGITRVDASVDKHTADYFDSNVVSRLSDNIGANQEISVILSLNTKSTLDAYLESDSKGEFTDYLGTSAAKNVVKKNRAASNELKKALDKAKISYKVGNSYEHLISGFEVILRAKDYNKLTSAVGNKATAIVGEVYAPAEAQKVENIVDVYETGIFDSSSCKYQGDGVVVAVLDTGLDYTHTAFSVSTFDADTDPENDALTLEKVTDKVNETDKNGNLVLSAARTTSNLKGEDVYVNRKVPYAYDYADKDPDVFPLSSEHGTHVAGVIAGKDDVITGVAPNAQLAIMKVFSDHESGARTSWILSALDDCVALGVDVINMSLGTAAGFTTQDDEARMEEVYEKIQKNGISLIAAAGNEDNAVTGSEKNGSNPLTSNPDSGIVGSPSTFESALSVASVGGVKTPYFLYNDEIMYFTEAATSAAKNKDFVDDILKTVGKDSYDFEYVTIPGVGSRADYTEDWDYYKGKIVLVKRGETTFENKVNIALNVIKAAGIIIYNNVSGTISMQVGSMKGAVCSISKDQGDRLAKNKTGILRISRDQVAGPFMSDFSSWGPTSDLRIKPEITAHGGEIKSAIPGQGYDRMSGTSMASPNMAGATALIRQFVKDNTDVFGELSAVEVTKRVNQLAMSTADIVYNKNGLAYAVRKQGAGLVNIGKATSADAYISTFNEKGEMDKTKLELGDDKKKTGVYEMSFTINNLTNKALSYNIGSIVMTEGVNTSYTGHGETTVTTEGYALNPKTEIVSVKDGQKSGSNVTVEAKGKATVTVKITLSEADKAYLDESFAYGMYVEGFITVKAASGTNIDMSVPYLAFYGDWTEAPIFDEEYYDTNADELNDGINADDKLMEDAYATRVIGGYYSDYIAPLGTYPFVQNPAATKIPANKEHIALSNYEDGEDSSLNKITAIAAGLLRNVKDWKLTITEDSTGKVIWTKEARNQRKSYTTGATIYQANMEVDFSVLEHNLKNNTKYTVTVETYIDYGKKEEQNNVRNTFTFPLYIDFEAPIVTGVEYRSEYDKSAKKWHLYADVSIYDNHYAMAVQFGHIVAPDDPTSIPPFSMSAFGKYMTPVYSSYNSTSKVTFELTDYLEQIKHSRGMKYEEGNPYYTIVENTNSFVATCYDYAMNVATYEIKLPDEVLSMYFDEEEITLNPNETVDLTSKLNVYPLNTWKQVLDYESGDKNIVDIVNQTAIAKITGVGRSTTVTVTGKDANNKTVSAEINIRVRSQYKEDGTRDPDYRVYDAPQVYKAGLTGYKTVKAYYEMTSTDRDIGLTGGTYFFANNDYSLSMYPSESVDLLYEIQTYFSNSEVTISFSSSRPDEIANVDENGRIVALAKGEASIDVNANINYFGKNTTYLIGSVKINVKDPYTTNGIYLSSYKGLGGTVEIPGDRGFTTIQSYAFSNYDFVDKDLTAGDVIDDEDPYHMKQTFLGENTITKIIIPEGVTTIESYAFARLTALKEVVLPTTLTKIGVGAFYGCNALTTINLDNVQFINDRAFMGCQLEEVNFNKIVAIGSYAFRSEQTGPNSYIINKFTEVTLPETAQSLDSGAFFHVANLQTVTFASQDIKIKLGEYVFSNCANLKSIYINATVIPTGAFYNCITLSNVTLGEAVSVIGAQAFAQTNVSSFTLAEGSLLTTSDGKFIYKESVKDGKKVSELVLVAPVLNSTHLELPESMTSIASTAFAGNSVIESVYGKNVTEIGAYAFADCPNLVRIEFPKLTKIGEYAFFNAASLTIIGNNEAARDQFALVTYIGDYAFAGTAIQELNVIDNAWIGEGAFYLCIDLAAVTIGNNVTIGKEAFSTIWVDHTYVATGVFDDENYYTKYVYEVKDEDGNLVKDAEGNLAQYEYYSYNFVNTVLSSLETLLIGDNVTIGAYAFQNAAKVKNFSLGSGARIGEGAFYDATGVVIDLSEVVEIGDGAFSGSRDNDIWPRIINGETVCYPAVQREINNKGIAVAVDYMYSFFAPTIETGVELESGEIVYVGIADLSNLDVENLGEGALGVGAFAYNQSLMGFILPDGLEKIPAHLFANCFNILYDLVYIPDSVISIGEYAFANTSFLLDLGDSDFYSIEKVGEGAFLNSWIVSVNFAEDAVVEDSAFEGCEFLGYFVEDGLIVEGLEKVVKIGAWAFAGTAMTTVDLSGATEIGDFAFGLSGVTEVKLGEGLKQIGENPFFGCDIKTFAKTEEVPVEGFDLTVSKEIDTYDVSDNVKVIGGVLYQVVPNDGLVLVSYPAASDAYAYTVEENTVRISARAFAAAPLANVTLPRSLKAIGDKAFFACDNLTTVIFNSIKAPILEEEFDETYMDIETLPLKGYLEGYEGLGIADYFMWNSTSVPNFYYGANFVDYVGAHTPNLVMVSPVNGTGYDTFIFGKYFGTFADGSTAITDNTLQVIKMIANLSANITLDDEAAVEAARRAYEALPNLDQKALVTNYSKLTNAESTIEYLKSRGEKPGPGGDITPSTGDNDSSVNALGIAGFTVAGVLLLVLAAFAAYVFLGKKKSKTAELDSTETVSEEGSDDTDNNDGNNDNE